MPEPCHRWTPPPVPPHQQTHFPALDRRRAIVNDAMSHNIGAEGVPRDTPPSHRTRHQISRSISEFSSPIRLHRHQSHTRAIRDQRERDGLSALSPTPQGRLSLDGSRSDGITSNCSPDPSRNASRRTSILMASGDDAPAAAPGMISMNGVGSGTATKALVEDALALERKRAVARERFVYSRRLDNRQAD